MRALVTFFLILLLPGVALAQSTSPDAVAEPLPLDEKGEDGYTDPITFSEYPVNTTISTQYANVGIIFGGSSTFISPDGANPTSPVLSGSPRFHGAIRGEFVLPGTLTPTIVSAFRLDAGYFDSFGSTRIVWYDSEGNVLGQRTNSRFGIERMTIEGGGIAAWQMSIVENEPAGFAVDNVSFLPIGPSVLFREKQEKDGSWGLIGDEIPGFDHVGFHAANVVYESHPNYPSGTYLSGRSDETVFVTRRNGVQSEFTRETFEHASTTADSKVIDFDEIPVPDALAELMVDHIESVRGYPFQDISYDDLAGTLAPAVQKGGNGAFTCVGLVEWAAERSNHNGGQGFIRNSFESFLIPDFGSFPPGVKEIPALSPQLLNYAMSLAAVLNGVQQWFQGFVGDANFVVTDPLGRQFGFSDEKGLIDEIPHAFFSGAGDVEYFFIPNALPGNYTVQLQGEGAECLVGLSAAGSADSVTRTLSAGATAQFPLTIYPTAGGPGDVNEDGVLNNLDLLAIRPLLNEFTNGLSHPADIDGDGLISGTDEDLLADLIANLPPVDTVPPVLTLLGEASVTVNVGDGYVDAGAIATDNVDGDLSAKISVISNVQPDRAGNYEVLYNVSDAAGNISLGARRQVTVQEKGGLGCGPAPQQGTPRSDLLVALCAVLACALGSFLPRDVQRGRR